MRNFSTLFFIVFFGMFPLTFAIAIVFTGIMLNLGVYTWLYVILMCSPVFALWYRFVTKRMEDYLKSLDNKPVVWDIEKIVAEYKELLKKKQKA
jgi:CBS domain containing-hemolysin-like protein